jgi:hypothetical protein
MSLELDTSGGPDTPANTSTVTEATLPPLEHAGTVPLDPMLLADPEELDHYGKPSPEQKAKADAESKKLADAVQSLTAKAILPEAQPARPNWALIPPVDATGQPFRFPRGRSVLFVKLLKEWTDMPTAGDRQIICWPLTPGDYRFALDRAQGDGNRVNDELTKQMIRAIDGHPVDWSAGTAYSPDIFWTQIGQKCRYLLTRIYLQLNTLSAKETRSFFETCIAVVTTG